MLPRGLGREGVIESGLRGTLLVRAEVAERQTRYVQGVVSIRSCGFKSHLRHHDLRW